MTEKKEHFLWSNPLVRGIGYLFTGIMIVLVKIYKFTISPLLPNACRYIPTCSEYSVEAFRVHGFFKGFYLTVKRVGSCHPWGGHGFDPVPPAGTKVIKFKKLKIK
jgi:putative membrane protein insertion efficiency factor